MAAWLLSTEVVSSLRTSTIGFQQGARTECRRYVDVAQAGLLEFDGDYAGVGVAEVVAGVRLRPESPLFTAVLFPNWKTRLSTTSVSLIFWVDILPRAICAHFAHNRTRLSGVVRGRASALIVDFPRVFQPGDVTRVSRIEFESHALRHC
jgi:hypothetical protein